MKLYGRQDTIEILNKRAAALEKGYRQNIAIIGDELIGKSYLIEHWLSSYCSNYVIPVYLKETGSNPAELADKFSGTLLFSFLKNSQCQLKEDLNQLLAKAEKHIPETCAAIRGILSHKNKKSQEIFSRLLELPEILHKETSKSCILIIDEFQRLERIGIKDIYAAWTKHIMLDRHTMYILISSRRHAALDILSTSLNLLFGNFEKIDLPAWDDQTCRLFLRERLKPLEAAEETSDFIIHFSRGRPFYLNLLCQALKEHLNKTPSLKAEMSSFIASASGPFIEEWGTLNRRFCSLADEITRETGSPQALRLLLESAKGPIRLGKISHSSGISRAKAGLLMDKLVRLEIIENNSGIYLLKDNIFAFWLVCAHSQRVKGYDGNSHTQKLREIFRENMENLFTEFQQARRKQIDDRIFELFNKFSNETVEFHKKRLRLNHFKEIKMLKLSPRLSQKGIIARSQNGLWITGLKEDRVSEEDMRDFVSACKRFKYNKSQKRIFIALNKIDDNARLIAKGEKIDTWDSEELNTLFDIYSQPRLIKQ